MLDESEVFPDDPGNGTPALVIAPFGRGTATYDCACDNGEVDGPSGITPLSRAQCEWLNSREVVDTVEKFYTECYQNIDTSNRRTI